MKKSFLLLCATTLTFSFARADETAPTPAQITERWRAYFQTLRDLPSWSYSSQMKLWEKDLKKPDAPAHLINEMKYKFARHKNLFRREMQVREKENAGFQKIAATYNGQKYQFAVHNPKAENIGGHMMRDLMQQSLKPFPNDETNTISMHFAVAMPFFIFIQANDGPLSDLAKPAAWAELQKQISKVEPSTWENRPGFLLTLSPSAKEPDIERGEVFMDSASGLPLHVVSIGKTTGATTGELKITKLQEATPTAPAFPLKIEISGAATADKPAGHGIIEVDPVSLSFAATFAPDFFKIPASAVEIITEGEKVVYSRYPMPKEPAKAPAKPTVNKAKTPAKTQQ